MTEPIVIDIPASLATLLPTPQWTSSPAWTDVQVTDFIAHGIFWALGLSIAVFLLVHFFAGPKPAKDRH
jgi:hypothetical protein